MASVEVKKYKPKDANCKKLKKYLNEHTNNKNKSSR